MTTDQAGSYPLFVVEGDVTFAIGDAALVQGEKSMVVIVPKGEGKRTLARISEGEIRVEEVYSSPEVRGERELFKETVEKLETAIRQRGQHG